MRYHIHYFVGSALTGTETQIDMTLDTAKSQAMKAVELKTADRAEVRDEQGSLLFQVPRTLRPSTPI